MEMEMEKKTLSVEFTREELEIAFYAVDTLHQGDFYTRENYLSLLNKLNQGDKF
jgi:hypothetical protein